MHPKIALLLSVSAFAGCASPLRDLPASAAPSHQAPEARMLDVTSALAPEPGGNAEKKEPSGHKTAPSGHEGHGERPKDGQPSSMEHHEHHKH